MSDEAADLRLDLPCDQSAPSAVRHALADGRDEAWWMGDMMLVASELVTNAVMHSGCRSEDLVSVELKLRPEAIVCSVSDAGCSGKKAEAVPAGRLHSGFGLHVVEQLASRWGHDREDGGRYRVWAELTRDSG